MAKIPTFKLIILGIALSILSACSTYNHYTKIPDGQQFSGLWQLLSEDQQALALLKRAISFAPISKQAYANHSAQVSANDKAYEALKEDKVIQDLLASQMSLTTQEIYINSSDNKLAIDFGVMGFFNFNIGKQTEVEIANIKIDAHAGWESETNRLVVMLEPKGPVKVAHYFQLLGPNLLSHNLSLQLINRSDPIILQRIYQRGPSSP